MGIFNFLKKNQKADLPDVTKLSDDWHTLVQEKKANTKMESVVTQRSIYKLLRNTFPSLDPFFASLQFDFDTLDVNIKTNEDVERVMYVLSQVCLRFNGGFHALKPEAIERYLDSLSNEDLIMAYIGIEYYRDSIDNNASLNHALKIAEQVLIGRSA